MSDGQTSTTILFPAPPVQTLNFEQQRYILTQWYEMSSGLQHQHLENEKELLRIRRSMELELAKATR